MRRAPDEAFVVADEMTFKMMNDGRSCWAPATHPVKWSHLLAECLLHNMEKLPTLCVTLVSDAVWWADLASQVECRVIFNCAPPGLRPLRDRIDENLI